MKSMSHGRFGRENDRWGFTQASAIRVTGRHIINIWRALRGELNLTQYTLENVTFHLLHRRYVTGFLELTMIECLITLTQILRSGTEAAGAQESFCTIYLDVSLILKSWRPKN